MPSFSKEFLTNRFNRIKASLQRGFTVKPDEQPLSASDLALLEQVAEAVVQRGMAVPATVFLESMGPMNFLGSQALHFLTPILELVFPSHEIERIARLLERRDTLTRLASMIEARAGASRTAGHP